MNNQKRNPVAALINKKNEVYIADLPAVFGRDDKSVDVYFFHESISREHCLFECINRRVTVRDLGSTVGTSVNGVRLEPSIPYHIEDGAKIAIGKVKFTFHVDYQEIAKREQLRNYSDEFSQPAIQNADSSEDVGRTAVNNSGRPQKTITISARELTDYEYGEEEVVFIKCGLKPEGKPVSFTSELKKAEIESALIKGVEKEDSEESLSEELKKTQVISRNDIIEEVDGEEEALSEEPVSNEAEEAIDESKEDNVRLLHLSWIDDETGKKKKVEIDQFPFSIGRKSDENDYALRKKGVSRKHCHFEEQDGWFYIIDDKSTNGVRLNGVKIKPEIKTKIKSGDKLNIADIIITVKID